MNKEKIPHYFLQALLAVLFVVVLVIFFPYINAFILGGTFAVIFYPMYKKFLSMLKGRKSASSLLTVFFSTFFVVGPVFFLVFLIFQKTQDLFLTIKEKPPEFLENITENALGSLGQFFPGAEVDIEEYAQQGFAWVSENIGPIFTGATEFFITLFLAMLVFYYLLKDGAKLKSIIVDISPLAREYTERIFNKIILTINSIFMGSLVIGVIQGILTGLGFFVLGVPDPILWGGVTAMLSILPIVGPIFVIAPASLYLFFINETFAAVALLIWGLVLVGSIDNILRPKLIERRGVALHPLLVLLSIIGGINLFGVSGLILGPVLLSFLMSVLEVYKNERESFRLQHSDTA